MMHYKKVSIVTQPRNEKLVCSNYKFSTDDTTRWS